MENLLSILEAAASKLHLYYGITEISVFDAFVIENLRFVDDGSGNGVILGDISLQIAPVNLGERTKVCKECGTSLNSCPM